MVLYASSLASPYALSYASPVRYAGAYGAYASPVRYAGYAGYTGYTGYAGYNGLYASAYNPWGYSSLYY